jgi:hypothetical protein
MEKQVDLNPPGTVICSLSYWYFPGTMSSENSNNKDGQTKPDQI